MLIAATANKRPNAIRHIPRHTPTEKRPPNCSSATPNSQIGSSSSTFTPATNATKPNGTFDYTIQESAGRDVVITPMPSPAASAMRPSQWTCISGNRSFEPRTIDIAGTVWDSVEVRVTPAAAISCTLKVVPA